MRGAESAGMRDIFCKIMRLAFDVMTLTRFEFPIIE